MWNWELEIFERFNLFYSRKLVYICALLLVKCHMVNLFSRLIDHVNIYLLWRNSFLMTYFHVILNRPNDLIH